MKYLPNNTLAYYNAAPQGHRHDLSVIPVAVFAAATKAYRTYCGQAQPHHEALTFYALNHCAALVKKSFTVNEPLPEWAQKVMAAYALTCSEQSQRMLHYILSICAREMRHLKTQSAAFWAGMTKDFGPEMVEFMKNISGIGSEETAVTKYMNEPPIATVGQYIKAMSHAFHQAQNWQHGYGGPKWGVVADAAVEMLTGKTSMEMLVDTGYTLAHNGGPIFNKGMMYHQYDNTFMTILDVQAAGQIPELILDATNSNNVHKTEEAKVAVKLIQEAKLQEFRGWVDWFQVEALAPEERKGGRMSRPKTSRRNCTR